MEGLESLITLLDADSKAPPGTGYQLVRLKLIKYFEWQRCVAVEELADETIDRVARRIAQGQQIENLMGYFYGVARLVHKEYERAQLKQLRAFATLPQSTEEVEEDNDDDAEAAKQHLECSRKCLQDLSEPDRSLIVAYCQPDERSKKERRQDLAMKLGIKRENLRLKAFRIREKLDKCVADCLNNDYEGK
jgi:DNA-directed RNA polymerase specialized sigma24 family protein